jgi:uncharacterized zinc-type alcohol dehydrogenase-like protein
MKIAILFDSGYGHTAKQAQAVADGVARVEGAAPVLIALSEGDPAWDVLEAADAIIFGSPTYNGTISARLKQCMEASTRTAWVPQKWRNKIAAGFTNSGAMHGDKLNSLVTMALFAAQHGMIWVGLDLFPGKSSEDLNRVGGWLGAMAQSDDAAPKSRRSRATSRPPPISASAWRGSPASSSTAAPEPKESDHGSLWLCRTRGGRGAGTLRLRTARSAARRCGGGHRLLRRLPYRSPHRAKPWRQRPLSGGAGARDRRAGRRSGQRGHALPGRRCGGDRLHGRFCRHCAPCQNGMEQHCANQATFTYNAIDRRDGSTTRGGYSNRIVAPEHFVLRLPDGIDLAAAAPLLCAGITTWEPLHKWKVGPGSRVAVVGLGGLGHMALKLATALGAETTLLTRSPDKEAEARAQGAAHVVLSSDPAQMAAVAGSFDVIVDTVPYDHDVNPYLATLAVDGAMVLVGYLGPLSTPVSAAALVFGRKVLAGSFIGGIPETQAMLDFCGERGVTPDVEVIAIQDINTAYARLLDSDVQYRFVIDMATLPATA